MSSDISCTSGENLSRMEQIHPTAVWIPVPEEIVRFGIVKALDQRLGRRVVGKRDVLELDGRPLCPPGAKKATASRGLSSNSFLGTSGSDF